MTARRCTTRGTWIYFGDGDLPVATVQLRVFADFHRLDHFKQVTIRKAFGGFAVAVGNRQRVEGALPVDRFRVPLCGR